MLSMNNHAQNVVKKLPQNPKKPVFGKYMDQRSEVSHNLFLLYVQVNGYLLFKKFFKKLKRSAIVHPATFSALFLKKNVSHVTFF